MGYNQIVVALLVLATATPLAYGQLTGIIPGLINPKLANITGRLCCAPNGNCGNGTVGIPGVTVDLNCTTVFGSMVRLGQAATGLAGFFNISVNLLGLPLVNIGGINGLLQCKLLARVPPNSTVCPILGTTEGILSATLSLVGIFLNDLFGIVLSIIALPFQFVTVNN